MFEAFSYTLGDLWGILEHFRIFWRIAEYARVFWSIPPGLAVTFLGLAWLNPSPGLASPGLA